MGLPSWIYLVTTKIRVLPTLAHPKPVVDTTVFRCKCACVARKINDSELKERQWMCEKTVLPYDTKLKGIMT
jgi:hypothetical protein